ncbi:MAG: class I SAM-dependent methyltransferase [Campylobacterota bacterium]
MNMFLHNFANKMLLRIEKGNLKVMFPNKEVRYYGEVYSNEQIYLKLNNYKLFYKILLHGDIGFAQSYMNNDFEVSDLTKLIQLALLNSSKLGIKSEDEKSNLLVNLLPYFNKLSHYLRRNSKSNSKRNISQHYDLSNEFYKLFLDDTMMYSAAVFENSSESLYEAQKRKITKLADKLNIKQGDEVLEIGSGWGSMAIHLAKHRKCKVTTVTLSEEQKKLCVERFKQNDVDGMIDIFLKDYRDLEGRYDAIIAVEMFEAVGKEYFDLFFKKCESLLKPSGVLALQVITMPDNRYKYYSKSTDFIQKYIFPGGHLPSVSKILEVTSKNTRLNLLNLEEFTEDYAKTLNIWFKNFKSRINEVKSLGFDEYFIRMWQMYLNYCEAAFITRNVNLVQLVFSRDQNIYLNKGLINE